VPFRAFVAQVWNRAVLLASTEVEPAPGQTHTSADPDAAVRRQAAERHTFIAACPVFMSAAERKSRSDPALPLDEQIRHC
jgi:hypothetical protein